MKHTKDGRLRFGILGAGKIAEKFTLATRLPMCKDICRVVAVASNTPGKAAAFAERNSIPACFDSYEELLRSSEVDCIYVANTPNFHYDSVMASLSAGKGVLCEKPLVTSPRLAEALFEEAKRRGLPLMEAMWSRYLPTVLAAREYIREGRIGRVIHVDTCFSIFRPYSPTARLYHPDLEGGALNDLGVYNLSVTSYLLGEYPDDIAARSSFSPEGMDAHTAALLHFPSGTTANMITGICFEAGRRHTYYGTRGQITMTGAFNGLERLVMVEETEEGKRETVMNSDFDNGFEFEICEFASLWREGRLESDLQSAADSVKQAELLERIHALSKKESM